MMTKDATQEDSTPLSDKTVVQESSKPENTKHSFRARLKKFLSTKKGRIIASTVILVVIVGTLAIVPATRYGISGTVIKKPISLSIVDAATNKPVTDASVSYAGKTARTDSKGRVVFTGVAVGPHALKVEKKYFHTVEQKVLVPILTSPENTRVSIQATGRQVLVKVMNKINTAPIEKAKVSVSDTTALTDKNGEATIVLPIRTKPQKVTITAEDFNQQEALLTVADKAGQKLDVPLIAAGKVYFLSKRTGTINVVKSNLDGSSAETVVEGTGQENDYNTVLLASRDWKYLALHAKRDSGKPKLYLINTTNGKLTVMDEGDADFQLAGWSGHQFVYALQRNKPNYWDDKKQALKSYDADSGRIATLDETAGGGTNQYDFAFESLGNVYILKDRILYTKDWNLSYYTQSQADKKLAIMTVNPNGTNKTRVHEFSEQPAANIGAQLYAPGEVYFQLSRDGKSTLFEYEEGKVTDKGSDTDGFFGKYYPTYLVSPTDRYTFWFEPRDGKNTLMVGDPAARNSTSVASMSEYVPYGWYGDDYLLMSKNGSELYIAPRQSASSPLKVTDYHKPGQTYPGYGYGYGGL